MNSKNGSENRWRNNGENWQRARCEISAAAGGMAA